MNWRYYKVRRDRWWNLGIAMVTGLLLTTSCGDDDSNSNGTNTVLTTGGSGAGGSGGADQNAVTGATGGKGVAGQNGTSLLGGNTSSTGGVAALDSGFGVMVHNLYRYAAMDLSTRTRNATVARIIPVLSKSSGARPALLSGKVQVRSTAVLNVHSTRVAALHRVNPMKVHRAMKGRILPLSINPVTQVTKPLHQR